ncbi:glycosyltransferase family 4 protein [Balneolaceae bacterium YR4-1]|uniref:Glycosyltransferase family 4 protein n=1 Tax=Halalkalibaculum roseum TaxID=2709311 RepID=A0A6M1SZR1_9BACT|nr:glycosyltransferase [Halalkalibaculum roseum]NGP76694.1 glycosyltransferase family 4 protein [Halalkalibaculum roseum]
MDIHQMKVFFGLVNYGTQSGFLARGLRERGIKAFSVTSYDPFERVTDLTLKHSGTNLIEKLYNYVWNKLYLFHCFFYYDIFHFYAGKTLTKSQWELPFYRLFGKKVVFEYLGLDVQKYKYSVENFKYTNIVYRISEERAEEHDYYVSERLRWHKKYADLQIVCAPLYSPFVPSSTVLPLGIDLDEFTYSPKSEQNNKVKIMHAPTHRGNKGTKYIIDAINQLKDEGYDIEIMLVENVSHNRLKEMYKECDIFVDQILSGWYGTASIEAMALGRPVVCHINKEFYKYIDYGDIIPIIDANPNNIYNVLKDLVENKVDLKKIASKGRYFVNKIHDLDNIVNEVLKLYNKKL